MKQSIILLICLCTLVGATFAQYDDTCYSDAIVQLQTLIDDEATLEQIAETAESLAVDCERAGRGGVLYSVSAKSTVNLRAGAGTDHDVVGRAVAGQAFEVFDEIVGDRYTWLEIRYEDAIAFIAKSLTYRLPDIVLEEDEDAVALETIPCIVAHSTRRNSRTTVQVVEFDGEDAEFEITRLSDNAVMRLLRSDYDAQTNGTYYRYGWQSAGSYILTIVHDEGEESVGFEIEGVKTHFLTARCD